MPRRRFRRGARSASAPGRHRALQRSVRRSRSACSRWASPPISRPLIHARLERAIAFRESLSLDATAYRLVHGEADLLPSLIVDRYADYVVLQTLSQGMDRVTPLVVASLTASAAAAGHSCPQRSEGARCWRGSSSGWTCSPARFPPRVAVREGPVEYAADLRHGQKTGLFLDQRENREAAARYARGRLLDCFSYHGGFALRLAPQCDSAEAVDISADAVARITANAARNGLAALRPARPTSSTSCAGWSVPANATTRSCSTRPPSPRTRRRCRTPSPATRTSTCTPCACWRQAAASCRAAARTTSDEEMFGVDPPRGVGGQPRSR